MAATQTSSAIFLLFLTSVLGIHDVYINVPSYEK